MFLGIETHSRLSLRLFTSLCDRALFVLLAPSTSCLVFPHSVASEEHPLLSCHVSTRSSALRCACHTEHKDVPDQFLCVCASSSSAVGLPALLPAPPPTTCTRFAGPDSSTGNNMVPSVAYVIRNLWSPRPFEHWEVPASFDPSKPFLRLLVDCRSERLHRFRFLRILERVFALVLIAETFSMLLSIAVKNQTRELPPSALGCFVTKSL